MTFCDRIFFYIMSHHFWSSWCSLVFDPMPSSLVLTPSWLLSQSAAPHAPVISLMFYVAADTQGSLQAHIEDRTRLSHVTGTSEELGNFKITFLKPTSGEASPDKYARYFKYHHVTQIAIVRKKGIPFLFIGHHFTLTNFIDLAKIWQHTKFEKIGAVIQISCIKQNHT